MKKFIGGISALVFLIGCLAILVAILAAWLYIVVLVAQAWGIGPGIVVFIGTILGAAFFYEQIRIPWRFWHDIWEWADGEIERRLK